jgi:hypothetical protein
MGLAKAVQHGTRLGGDLLGRGKQHVGVDIALQRLAGAADFAAHDGAGLAQVGRPVQAQHFAVERFIWSARCRRPW